MSQEAPGAISIPDEDAPKNPGRRKFLKEAIGGAFALGVASVTPYLLKEYQVEENLKPDTEDSSIPPEAKEVVKEPTQEEVQEKILETLSPLEQLEVFGEVKDLQAGVDTLYNDHYHHLTSTGEGKKDMQDAVKILSRLNMKKIVEPFKKHGLPKELSYMIPIQETRGKKMVSQAGARGINGIMPKTAKDLGFSPSDADNPYKASEMTAKYLATERDNRFGNNKYLLLHAYSSGGGLYGYTKTERKKEDRSLEGFYSYMEDYINNIYKDVEEHGYYRHTIDSVTTNVLELGKRFKVPVVKILEANNLELDTELHEGDVVTIPYKDMKLAAEVLFRKPLEAIRYVPELKAKYKALKNLGLLTTLEKGMRKGV